MTRSAGCLLARTIREYASMAALATLYAENSAGHPRASTAPAAGLEVVQECVE